VIQNFMPQTTTSRVATVVTRREIADSVIEIELELGTTDSFHWMPGAHVDLLLPGGLVRQYSLCGMAGVPDRIRLAILDEPASRGGSRFIAHELAVGDAVEIDGPRNTFGFGAADEYAFVAGGIGITPLLQMIAEAERRQVPWRLAYFGRARSTMGYLDELGTYGQRVTVVSKADGGSLDLGRYLSSAGTRTAVYCCGPERLIDAAANAAADHGLDFHREYFVPKTLDPRAQNTEFEVVLDYTGVRLTVPADRSILDVVEEAGVMVLSSCTEGTCGTCETRVLLGVPDARDSVLTADEQALGDRMMICVSRARGDQLVLDL
jgi:ferredoxin-NADP reductase